MDEVEIKPEDIVSKLSNSGSDVDESTFYWFDKLQQEKKETETTEKKENEGILGMRKVWSRTVLCLIVAIVIFDMVLVILYGLGKLDFQDSNVVIVIITDNFLKIFGLGYLITREIFKKIYHR
ncbi:MAG TPA: hypothetical protein VGO63_01825 [Candidatus Paceibacterota bacterium]|jgi:hypothetical protein|nr:hypothetical protein [Candidatus Paceibacterota bacterium]